MENLARAPWALLSRVSRPIPSSPLMLLGGRAPMGPTRREDIQGIDAEFIIQAGVVEAVVAAGQTLLLVHMQQRSWRAGRRQMSSCTLRAACKVLLLLPFLRWHVYNPRLASLKLV